MIHIHFALLGRAGSTARNLVTALAICIALLVGFAMPSGAAAQPPDAVPAAGPIVRCEPVSITGLANGVVTADVYIQDVVALYGADVQVSFDVSIVQVLDENPNVSGIQIQPLASFLQPENVLRNVVDNVAGTVRYAVNQLNPTPPATGSGSLMRFRFQPLQSGSFTIEFLWHQLVDRDGQPIANTVVSCPVTINVPTHWLYLPLVMR